MAYVDHSLTREDIDEALDMLYRQLTANKLEREQTEACIKLFLRKQKRMPLLPELPDGED